MLPRNEYGALWYRVEVLVSTGGGWTGNDLRFPTIEKAREYGRDLAARWTLVCEWRIVREEPAHPGFVEMHKA